MTCIAQGDWSVAPHFVYNETTGLIHEVKTSAMAANGAAQDPVVSSSELGTSTPRTSKDTVNPTPESSASNEYSVALVPPPGMNLKQQIEFLEKVCLAFFLPRLSTVNLGI